MSCITASVSRISKTIKKTMCSNSAAVAHMYIAHLVYDVICAQNTADAHSSHNSARHIVNERSVIKHI